MDKRTNRKNEEVSLPTMRYHYHCSPTLEKAVIKWTDGNVVGGNWEVDYPIFITIIIRIYLFFIFVILKV